MLGIFLFKLCKFDAACWMPKPKINQAKSEKTAGYIYSLPKNTGMRNAKIVKILMQPTNCFWPPLASIPLPFLCLSFHSNARCEKCHVKPSDIVTIWLFHVKANEHTRSHTRTHTQFPFMHIILHKQKAREEQQPQQTHKHKQTVDSAWL